MKQYIYKFNMMKIQRIQNKIIREATDADHRTSNIDIQTQTQIKDIYEEIYEQTDLFYKELRLPILNDIGNINKQNAPFKIKYNLPHKLVTH